MAKSSPSVHLAITHIVSTVGRRCDCVAVLDYTCGEPDIYEISSSVAKEVKDMGNNIYHVTPFDGIYVVHVVQ